MGSKNTPNGGIILKTLHTLMKEGCTVNLDYGYGDCDHYPRTISVKLPHTRQKVSMFKFNSILRWYRFEYFSNTEIDIGNNQKSHVGQIVLERVWT